MRLIFAVMMITGLFSCRRGPESHPSWEASILAPLLVSSLTIDDLLADSLLQTNADNSVSLVFTNSLYHFSITDQAIDIPDTTIEANFSLQSLTLADQTLVYPLTLGQICSQLGVLGQFIIASNTHDFYIPPIVDISTGENEIDATGFFESADLESGFIDLTLENGLPIEISNCVFIVKNKIDQQILTQDTFQHLLPGQTQSKSINLAGKHVEGTLTATIIDLDSPGGFVTIDTSDAILITMVAHDLVVSQATAIFPSQNLIEQDQETSYNISGGAQLDLLEVKSGLLVLTFSSTLQQKSHFEFSLPSAHDTYGNSISVSEDLPPASPGGSSSFSKTFDLSGFSINLTGIDGGNHNTYFTHLVASIDSTGDLVTISKTDSININYSLQQIVPEYIKGYLGQQILQVGPDETTFDALKNIKSGSLGLEDLSVDMTITNGIGVEGRINIYDITSINSITGSSVPLTWNLLNKPLSIANAQENPFVPSITTFTLNKTNSNIKSLIEILPDKLQYALDVFINPNGNTSNYQDFASDSSSLDVDLALTMPLSFIANDLVVQDTVDFSLGSQEEGDPTIKDGTFNVIATNGFPLDAALQVYFYDDQLVFLDSLFHSGSSIEAAKLNDQCIVSEATKTVLTISIDASRMNLLRTASHAVIRANFNTASTDACSSYLKIYNDYTLDLKLTGLFTYYTGY